MREILFRGKGNQEFNDGEWFEGYLWRGADHTYITPCNLGVDYNKETHRITAVAYRVDNETVGQYTGLTDKNGTKIFEGDICRILKKDINVSVHWSGPLAEYVWSKRKLKNKYLFKTGSLCTLYEKNIEVIGNIHDNPELLEV